TRTAEEPVPVLIMAGGLGRRLGDITRYIPKPLVEVAGRPILATLIQDLAAQGFRRVILSVGHKAELIERYFGDGRRFGVTISYVRDGRPLGTAGAIAAALPQLEREFIVTNADLLTRVNFGELVAFHRAERDDLTIGIIESTYELRYGLVEIDGTRVTGIREKRAQLSRVGGRRGAMLLEEPSHAARVDPFIEPPRPVHRQEAEQRVLARAEPVAKRHAEHPLGARGCARQHRRERFAQRAFPLAVRDPVAAGDRERELDEAIVEER